MFRIAITDRRILEVKDGKVRFSWKDYRTGRFRQMKLDVDEFIRRFLLHVLPKGFFKVRYYGIFSSRYRKQNIETAKQLLEEEAGGQKGRSIGRRRPGLGKAGYGVVRNQGTDKKLQAAQLSGV